MFHSQAFKQAQIYAYNAQEHVWGPGSAQTRWGSLSARQPHSRNEGPTSKGIWLRGEIEDGSGGEGSGGEEKGEEGTRGRNFPLFRPSLRPWTWQSDNKALHNPSYSGCISITLTLMLSPASLGSRSSLPIPMSWLRPWSNVAIICTGITWLVTELVNTLSQPLEMWLVFDGSIQLDESLRVIWRVQ